jgi:hypothetical protein
MSRLVNVPMLFRLWFSDLSDDDLCIELRIVRATMSRLAKQYALPPRLTAKGDPQRRLDDPTAEEIAERAAIERSRWTPEEEKRRAVGRRAVEVAAYEFDVQQRVFRY